MNIAIIGTAGRKDDAERLNARVFQAMLVDAKERVETLAEEYREDVALVSGGAAVADHIAVRLFLDKAVEKLYLFLPAPFNGDLKQFDCAFEAGRTSHYYHQKMKRWYHPRSSNRELAQAIVAEGCSVATNLKGFKARNLQVAKNADVVLAYTFGEGEAPKDGGTFHTWSNATHAERIHVPIGTLP